ncbi:MAG: DNA polymerase III subunit delta [Actinomycetota bacterium]|nr:DNA polymerase III subunit delta [Actinomycetota bacterium]MDQ6945931.1 DNA polymerase III subunit delta [Actinomycetota bacterium]
MSPPEGRTVWLIEGDDPVLVAEATRTTIDDLVGHAQRSLVVEDFAGDELDLAVVADAAATPPFLADRRIVVVRDVGRFGTEELVPLLAYLEAPLDTTSIVLVAGGGRLAPKLLAAVKAHGHVTGTSVKGRTAKAFVHDRIKAAPVRIDARAAALLEAHLGEDVSRLASLLEVLGVAFEPGARLGPDDIAPYLGDAGSVAPWDLTDSIDSGNTDVALGALHRLLEAGERHPLVVHAIIARHVGSLLRVDGPAITTEEAAAVAMGIAGGRSTFPAKKALTSARRYGSARIATAVGLVADAEVALKGGRGEWPDDLTLEVLVARLCRLARSPARAGGSRR